MFRLGDKIEQALTIVGITQERVEAWVGLPCGCQERIDKLNQLGFWAARVVSGKVQDARRFLSGIMDS